MKLRSGLMMALKVHLARTGLSQSQAAKLFGVTQPRVSDLMRGEIDLFGLDALVNMAAAAGMPWRRPSAWMQAMTSARDRDSAATQRQRAAYVDTTHDGGALRQSFLDQADTLDLLAARKDTLAAKEAQDRNDPTTGAVRAVKDYLAEVVRAGDATYGVVSNAMHGLQDLTVSALSGNGAKGAARAWVINNGQPVQARQSQQDTSQGTIVTLVLDAVANDIASGGKTHDAVQQRFGLNPGGTTPRH